MKLKLFIVSILLIAVSFTERHYVLPCTVYDQNTEIIVLEDPTENLWDAKGDTTKKNLHVLFDNNNTESDRSDDRVVFFW